MLMTAEERISRENLIKTFDNLPEEGKRAMIYMGQGIEAAVVCLSKENQDAKSSAD